MILTFAHIVILHMVTSILASPEAGPDEESIDPEAFTEAGQDLTTVDVTVHTKATTTVRTTTQNRNYVRPTEIRIGYISPRTGSTGLEQIASATTMAIEDAWNSHLLPGINVSIHWRESGCDGKTALGMAVELKYNVNVDAYLGMPCSDSATNAGKLVAYWNLPHFAYSSPDPVLANKTMYSTLVRLVSPFNKLAQAVVQLFKYHKWNRAVMLTGMDPEYYCDYASRSLDDRFRKFNLSLADWLKIDQADALDVTDQDIDSNLDEIKLRGRIVIICVQEIVLKRVMMAAQRKGMTDGEYVFIYPSLFPSPNIDKLWLTGNQNSDKEARKSFAPLLQVVSGFVANQQADEFRRLVAKKNAEPPWNERFLLNNKLNASIFALYAYDAVYQYLSTVDRVVQEQRDHRDGQLIFDMSTKMPFWKGKSGLVMLDDNGDRQAEYWVYQLAANATVYTVWATINITALQYSVLTKSVRYWGAATKYNVPRDRPACGFFDELCPSDTTERDVGIAIAFVILTVGALVVAMSYYIYRKKKFEDEVERMLWKAMFSDIVFMKVKNRSCSTNNTSTNESMSPAKESKASSIMSVLGRPELQGILDVAFYKGDVVAVRRLRRTSVVLTRAHHVELKTMRDLNHENLNTFVGFCVDPPNICILSKYCSKGSLQDVLENENVKLDSMFKSSLIADLIMGMDYLHHSQMRVHGRLRSTNCVIDGRWVLKVADFGLIDFREDAEEEHELYKSMLWTSPEVLRNPDLPHKSKQKADVYSFAIILQEIIFRCGPYETTGELPMIPKDLIGRVRNGESTPYRPEIPQVITPDSFLSDMKVMMCHCWEEDPSNRPDFSLIKSRFLNLNKGKRVNIMDNMIRMMEKYANNLEEVVAERTYQLTEEKKKTDMLLYRMLPEIVANKLKLGQTVEPEVFENASIYFSDIVQFTELASASSPMEVVDFLNDLWTEFDDTIAKHNVYKVETIGDAYMVCSGLPVRTNRHATEISDMALHILSRVSTFTIRHRPALQLRVRIGLHSGSVATGVIGITMPRYCLFGDTVNTASRMESTGKPQRIQISCSTREALIEAGGYFLQVRGEIPIKGKGLQTTYWLLGREGMTDPVPQPGDDD